MRGPPSRAVLHILALLFSSTTSAFLVGSRGTYQTFLPTVARCRTLRLYYQNSTATAGATINPSFDVESLKTTTTSSSSSSSSRDDYGDELSSLLQQRRRNHFKEKLITAAIENYDMYAYQQQGMTTTIAEDIMKELEPLRPWDRPAHHNNLNARWSFVFTGVPTIGMKLITLLSRISFFSQDLIDFEDVYLEVSQQQTQVKAVVSFQVLGVPLELNVLTGLEPNYSSRDGTFLRETFQGIHLAGVEIPTPGSWKRARDLEISYLDEDMMIARTAGGEPHFLLRHSPCSTDDNDDECDIDNTVTDYFRDAHSKYGKKLSRSLVDRAYGSEGDVEGANILELVQSILDGRDAH